jgi:hypothetical protein
MVLDGCEKKNGVGRIPIFPLRFSFTVDNYSFPILFNVPLGSRV